MLLDPGMDLTLRPMKYPDFYEQYRAAIRNTWTVEEVDLASDLADLATFEAVARVGSMTGAAEQLMTVQSNVTARVRLLERRLAVPGG